MEILRKLRQQILNIMELKLRMLLRECPLNIKEGLSKQLGMLINPEACIEGDAPPQLESFLTLLEFILHAKPNHAPSLGLDQYGNFLVCWQYKNGKLTMECFPDNKIKWLISYMCDKNKYGISGKNF